MKKSLFILPLLTVLAVSGCKGVKQELGVGRNSPDEFTVVKRAPLTMPPGYDLRPPADGTAPPAAAAAAQAKTYVLGENAAAPASKAGADDAFLGKMGADHADNAIRSEINRENGYIALENRTVADKLIFWKDPTPAEGDKNAPVVDAAAEKERIEKNKEEGKPVNDGKVPTIEKKKSTLDRIF